LRHDERYAIGAVIAHNSLDPVPGAGSCIFLHVWQSEGMPTAGCTAGALADITEICSWLDAAAAPLLVQLPVAEYAHFRESWALP
jgi:L,D-peptidoglycan transpeptidase YkuD (ErfK/YbiS/YcfS/YnhG family)